MSSDSAPEKAFAFTGNWREFAPIAFTNLLLSVVTLGIYVFWARTRERHYLWSHTRFIDDRLEWTGTGMELLIGYIFALIFFVVPFGVLNLILQGVLMRGHPGAAAILGLTLYLSLMYLTGVAIFRALRYRLGRTFWHGIRGGSDSQGLALGWSYLWRTITGVLVLGLLIPWSMTSLWNERWDALSFGPHRFDSNASSDKIFLRFLLFYLVPGAIIIAVFVRNMMVALSAPPVPTYQLLPSLAAFDRTAVLIAVAAFYLVFFVIGGLIAIVYYAAYFREVVGKLSLGGLEFDFDARTWDWIKLYLGNIALVTATLGIGRIFLGYRNWAFFIRHMNAYGAINLDELTQSTARLPGQGEGLLDAFDIGAF